MIRAVQKEDIPEITVLVRESFMTVAESYGITKENAPRFTAFSISEERLCQQLEEHRPMFVFENEGRVLGYYSLQLLKDCACELNNLAVLPESRHQCIGGQLLQHAFDTAKRLGCTLMHIGIVEENTVLRKWYEAHGAVHTGTKKFDFFPFTCGYLIKELQGDAQPRYE